MSDIASIDLTVKTDRSEIGVHLVYAEDMDVNEVTDHIQKIIEAVHIGDDVSWAWSMN